VFYCSEQNISKATLAAQLKAIAPDVLYINGIYSKAFSRWPLAIGRQIGMRTVVAARGMLSPHALGVKPFKKYLFLTWMRWLSAYAHVIFHATSEVEKTDIQKVLGSQMNVQVVPNLARLNQIAPQAIQKEAGVMKLVSVGRIAPEKGTLHALQALKVQTSTIVLDLYGTCYNEAYWNECLQVIAQLPSNIKANYNGPCPSDEVAAHLAAAHALLLPSEGENYGHSIVESLGQGRPVLISKHTPWQDLATQKAGWDVTHTDLPSALAQLAAMDQACYDEWCRGAAAYYEKQILVPFAANKTKYLQLFEK
jgi:glycosyltransferase involved in cell wall biosynthesis